MKVHEKGIGMGENVSYEDIERAAKRKWDQISHPLDSLGVLETDVTRLCAMQGSLLAPDISKRAAVVFCGDHGVVEEGVTQTGQDVTRIMAEEFAAGNGIVNIFAGRVGADVFAVDVGMNCPRYPEKEIVTGAVIDRKVAFGTNNLYRGDAMTEEEMKKALSAGIEVCTVLKEQGYRILTCGEMGIGNTTSSSIIAAALTGLSAEEVTGRGAGLSHAGLEKKTEVVRKVLAELRDEQPREMEHSYPSNAETGLAAPEKVLMRAGGFEVAGMTGLFLGAAKCHIPVIIDGVISAAAALLAARIDSEAQRYMLASHVSQEIAAQHLLRALGLEAPITAGLHQGEGTGALLLLPLLDMAIDVYRDMGSFDDMSIESYKRME